MKTSHLTAPLLFGILLLTGGCAGTAEQSAAEDAAADEYRDPLEKINRVIWKSNRKSDRYTFKPAAEGYVTLPRPMRTGVGNFFTNLGAPYTVANDVLQGKPRQAGRDTLRFLLNSTFGLFGLVDVARRLDLQPHREDFGQTLAVWGVPEGPYLMLPLFGPSSVRDVIDIPLRFTLGSPTIFQPQETGYAQGLRLVHGRAGLLGLERTLELQPDEYLFVRDAYRQQREVAIYDGAPPETDDESFLDALFDDEDEETEEFQ